MRVGNYGGERVDLLDDYDFLARTITKKRDVFANRNSKSLREAGQALVRGAKQNILRIFAKIQSEPSAGGPWNRAKFSVRFRLAGSSLPMWPCALAVWDCRTPHQDNFYFFRLFFGYVVIFEIFELHSVSFFFSSMFSSSEPQAISLCMKSSISPSVS